MLALGPHAGFIVSAYGVTLAVLAGLVGWVYRDARTQKRLLEDLEARGVTRRSAKKRPAARPRRRQ